MQLTTTANTIVVLAFLALCFASSPSAAWFWSGPEANEKQQQQQQSKGPIAAEARFSDLDGVSGSFKLVQLSLNEPTEVKYSLAGLKGNNKLYHVHVKSVPTSIDLQTAKHNATLLKQLCSPDSTGGHWNPLNVTANPTLNATLDKFEVGDLSGKHGPMKTESVVNGNAPLSDHYQGQFKDPNLPLTGPNGIIGRSIVIHKNDGSRWVCATIHQITFQPNFLS